MKLSGYRQAPNQQSLKRPINGARILMPDLTGARPMALQIPGGRSEHDSGSIIHFLPMDAANNICPIATTSIASKK